MARGPTPQGREIYVEFIVRGAFVKATAIDSLTGQEASIVGPASSPQEVLAMAARRKLDYLRKRKGGG